MRQLVGMVGAGIVATLLMTCGPSGMEAVLDASAQTGCGTCTTGGVARVMTADSDPAQQVGGVATTDTDANDDGFYVGTLASGPLFLTDARRGGSFGVSLYLSPGSVCEETGATTTLFSLAEGENLHGVRYFAPAGTTLCVSGSVDKTVSWAGFRPYE